MKLQVHDLHPAVGGWAGRGLNHIRLMEVITPTRILLAVPNGEGNDVVVTIAPDGWGVDFDVVFHGPRFNWVVCEWRPNAIKD